MSDELTGSELFMPIMSIEQARARRQAVVEFTTAMFEKGRDYGAIPGTDKPTLLKPGAERLATFFGLTPVFVTERELEQWGDDGREPLFYYRIRCDLYRFGTLVGSGGGSCNSREARYRWRNAERVCPVCGKAAIIKGKPEFGGGWVCFKKKDGCGEKFAINDPAIVEQQVGKVANADISDMVNTVFKMAQKRAFIAAILFVTNTSEFYTQDVEDMPGFGVGVDGSGPLDDDITPTMGDGSPAPTRRNNAPPTSRPGQAPAATPAPANVMTGQEMGKAYREAKEFALKSGKFSSQQHLDAAWTKIFTEYQANKPENAQAFLAAWTAYVAQHAQPKPKAQPVPVHDALERDVNVIDVAPGDVNPVAERAVPVADLSVPLPSKYGPNHANADPDEIGASVDDDGEADEDGNPFLPPPPATRRTGDYLSR